MDLEVEPQQALGHRRALDVPARPPAAPGRVPGGVLAGLLCLPQREVERVELEVGALHALALVHVVHAPVRQLSVLRIAADLEVHVAGGGIGVLAVDQTLDHRHDLGDRLARARLVVGPAQPETVGVGEVRVGHLARELVAGDGRLARGRVDLVVDVGDVDHQRDGVALVLEEPLEQREHHERARVADVDRAVHGWAAGIDPDPAGLARLERTHLAGAGVVQADLAHSQATLVGRPLALAARQTLRPYGRVGCARWLGSLDRFRDSPSSMRRSPRCPIATWAPTPASTPRIRSACPTSDEPGRSGALTTVRGYARAARAAAPT